MPRSSGSRVYAVVCPHCGKGFESELLSSGSDRHKGFKCPHCRLFVAFARVEEQQASEENGSPS
jgi:ssDNA-binding Zn-finger/Zn-ribbon topoisomerase 1